MPKDNERATTSREAARASCHTWVWLDVSVTRGPCGSRAVAVREKNKFCTGLTESPKDRYSYIPGREQARRLTPMDRAGMSKTRLAASIGAGPPTIVTTFEAGAHIFGRNIRQTDPEGRASFSERGRRARARAHVRPAGIKGYSPSYSTGVPYWASPPEWGGRAGAWRGLRWGIAAMTASAVHCLWWLQWGSGGGLVCPNLPAGGVLHSRICIPAPRDAADSNFRVSNISRGLAGQLQRGLDYGLFWSGFG